MKFKRINIFIAILFIICLVGCSYVKNIFSNNATQQKSISEQITESTIIIFSDKNLEKTIREEIQSPTGDILMGDVDKITNLKNTKDKNITSLSGIENLINLSSLNLSNNQISNIEPLEGLTNLTCLELDNNQISNISPLKELTNMTDLDLSSNKINNLDSLKGLNKLTSLNLYANQINDYSAIYDYYENLKSTDIASAVIPPKPEAPYVNDQVAMNTIIAPKQGVASVIHEVEENKVIPPKPEAPYVKGQVAVNATIPPKEKTTDVKDQVAVSTVATPNQVPNAPDQIAESPVITSPDESLEKPAKNIIEPLIVNFLKDDIHKIATFKNAEVKSIANLLGTENPAYLTSLNLSNNQISDIESIEVYTNSASLDLPTFDLASWDLVTLHLATNQIKDSPIYDYYKNLKSTDNVSVVINPKPDTSSVDDQVAVSAVANSNHEAEALSNQVVVIIVVILKHDPANVEIHLLLSH